MALANGEGEGRVGPSLRIRNPVARRLVSQTQEVEFYFRGTAQPPQREIFLFLLLCLGNHGRLVFPGLGQPPSEVNFPPPLAVTSFTLSIFL